MPPCQSLSCAWVAQQLRGVVAQHSVSDGASDVLRQRKLAAGYLVYGCVHVFQGPLLTALRLIHHVLKLFSSGTTSGAG